MFRIPKRAADDEIDPGCDSPVRAARTEQRER
jgi:hypothetical protein